MEKAKVYKDLKLEDKVAIYKDRLQCPEMERADFCKKHNITWMTLSAVERLSWYDKTKAVKQKMTSLLKKDLEILSNIQDVNEKFVTGVNKKKVISNRDVDSLDKMSNTIMKKTVIVDKMTQEEESWEALEVTLTI